MSKPPLEHCERHDEYDDSCHDCYELQYGRYHRPRKLTQHERHQLAADAGHDTWEDYRGER